MPDLDFEKILNAFENEGVQYILVGGMAAIGHGVDYATKDIDFCYQRKNENFAAIIRALKPSNPRLRAKDDKFNFYGFMVKTLSLEDLIKAKQAAGRTKDKLHLLELEAIREKENEG